MSEGQGGFAGFAAAPIARVFEGDEHAGFGVVEEAAEVEEVTEFAQGEGGGGYGGPEALFQEGVGADFDFESRERADDGLFSGEIELAGFGAGFLLDDEAVLLLLL